MMSARKRKLGVKVRGQYSRRTRNNPAFINLFIDQIANYNYRYCRVIPYFREQSIAQVLYHEIGHHIHAVIHPKHQEPEDFANLWESKLWKLYVKRKYWYLQPFMWVDSKLDKLRWLPKHSGARAILILIAGMVLFLNIDIRIQSGSVLKVIGIFGVFIVSFLSLFFIGEVFLKTWKSASMSIFLLAFMLWTMFGVALKSFLLLILLTPIANNEIIGVLILICQIISLTLLTLTFLEDPIKNFI